MLSKDRLGLGLAFIVAALGLGALTARFGTALLPLVAVGVVLAVGALVEPARLMTLAAVLAPFGILDRFAQGAIPGQAGIADVVLAAFAVSAMMHPAKRRGARLPVIAVLLVTALIGIALLSTMGSVFLSEGLRKTGRMLVVAAVLVGAWRSLDADDAYRGMRAFFLSAVAASLVGVVMTGAHVGSVGVSGGLPRLWGGLVDPNHFGVLLAMAIVGAAFGLSGGTWRGTTLAFVGFLFVAEGLTLSRGAIIGLAAGILTALLLGAWAAGAGRRLGYASRMTAGLLTAASILLLVVTLVPGLLGIAVERYAGLADPLSDPTGALRVRIWTVGVSLLDAHPWLGVGPGAFPSAIAATGQFGQAWEAHNSLLETTVETGYVGGAALVMFVVWSVLAGAAAVRRKMLSADVPDAQVALAAGLLGAIVAGIGGSLFVSNALYEPPFVLMAALFVCSLSGLGTSER